jgi:hypothetical protein
MPIAVNVSDPKAFVNWMNIKLNDE